MQKWLKSWFGPRLRLLVLLLGLIGIVSSCGATSPLSLLTGSGPNVAANTQAGKTNNQTIGTTEVDEGQKIVRPKARDITQTSEENSNKVQSEKIETVVVNELDPKFLLLFVFAFIVWSYFLYMLPSPDQIWKKKK
jgi:hypothetical protein